MGNNKSTKNERNETLNLSKNYIKPKGDQIKNTFKKSENINIASNQFFETQDTIMDKSTKLPKTNKILSLNMHNQTDVIK